ncbi:hypothetical protein PG991_006540 [Apiospora marii]|uniref:Alpha/beta hydrolase fold-3 domain-containing protein n=1 Tax=Apiospora marii TaxID=335849 RepID=A0ABR1S110_9PEZI
MAQQSVPAATTAGGPPPWIARQPLSTLYTVWCLATILARLPYWILKFALFASQRPVPTWTFRQSLMLTLTKALVSMASVTQAPVPLTLEPGKEKEHFLVAQPASEADYVGPLKSDIVKPAPVGITCFPRAHAANATKTAKQKQLESESQLQSESKVVLHVHGGAFVLGDGRTAQLGFGASLLLQHAGVDRVYCPQYRLACRPDPVPFPGALQDVLTSYLYLVRDLGIPPRNIVLSGDSAGGNLIIGLLRYLVEHPLHETPHSAVLVSPWVAPVDCLGPDLLLTSNPHYGSDLLPPAFLRWGAAAYARLVPAADPYISPLGRPFVTPVPLFVTLGSAEVLEVEGARWVREMRDVGGEKGGKKNDIELSYETGAPHDTFLLGGSLGFEDSAREVTIRIGEFIRRKSRASSADSA